MMRRQVDEWCQKKSVLSCYIPANRCQNEDLPQSQYSSHIFLNDWKQMLMGGRVVGEC